MPTIPQRVASAFAVLCGQYGDVTTMAKGREQSRQSLYREAETVVEAVNGLRPRSKSMSSSENSPSGRPKSMLSKRG
jgi:hypothetical protein